MKGQASSDARTLKFWKAASVYVSLALQALAKMKCDWEAISFNFVPYKDTDISILAAIDDVQVLMDDHIVKTTTMKNSPFIKPFEAQINEWDQRLVGGSTVRPCLPVNSCLGNLSPL